MLASNILDLMHLNPSEKYRQERSVGTYRAACGTLNAQRTNNSFFSLGKKRLCEPPGGTWQSFSLSEDSESLLHFLFLVVVLLYVE